MQPEFGNQKHNNLPNPKIFKEVERSLKGQINCPFCGSTGFCFVGGNVLKDKYLIQFNCTKMCEGRCTNFYFNSNGDLVDQVRA